MHFLLCFFFFNWVFYLRSNLLVFAHVYDLCLQYVIFDVRRRQVTSSAWRIELCYAGSVMSPYTRPVPTSEHTSASSSPASRFPFNRRGCPQCRRSRPQQLFFLPALVPAPRRRRLPCWPPAPSTIYRNVRPGFYCCQGSRPRHRDTEVGRRRWGHTGRWTRYWTPAASSTMGMSFHWWVPPLEIAANDSFGFFWGLNLLFVVCNSVIRSYISLEFSS